MPRKYVHICCVTNLPTLGNVDRSFGDLFLSSRKINSFFVPDSFLIQKG